MRDTGMEVGSDVIVELAPEGPQRGDLADDISAALTAPSIAERDGRYDLASGSCSRIFRLLFGPATQAAIVLPSCDSGMAAPVGADPFQNY
jgi:hypothetical protein